MNAGLRLVQPDERRGPHHPSRSRKVILERLGRAGFVARGVVFALIGLVALRIATGQSGPSPRLDRQGALETMRSHPGGATLLSALGVGLLCFALFTGARSVLGIAGTAGNDWRGRASAAGTTAVYAIAGCSTLMIAWQGSRQAGGDNPAPLTARIMGYPGGRILVGLIGCSVIILGVKVAYQGIRGSFMRDIGVPATGLVTEGTVRTVGTCGYLGKGTVTAVAGSFAVAAAITFDPGQAKGLDGTLKTLAAQSYGQWLLGAAALALIGFGAFCFCQARYQHL